MNLLITGAWREAKEHISFFQTEGHRVKYMQYEQDELPCAPEWVEGIIGNGIFLFHSIEEFVNLHYIQLTSAGYDRVPMDYIKEHKIQIYNARGVYSVPMAEFAVAGVLALYKRLPGFWSHNGTTSAETAGSFGTFREKSVGCWFWQRGSGVC